MGWQPTSPWNKPKPPPTKPPPGGTGYGPTGGGYYIPKPVAKPTPQNMNFTGMGGGNYAGQVGYKSEGEKYLDATMPGWRNSTENQQAWAMKALYEAKQGSGAFPQLPGQVPIGPGGGSRGGGGGGGGGAGATGLDQDTLDWLMGQLGKGRPQDLAFNPVDLPDPSQFYGAFNTQPYDVARQGVTSGIEGIRQRGNQAFDTAQGELNRYQNPYASASWATNPEMSARMAAMYSANGVPTSINADTQDQGVQADRAFGNVMALLGANDQSRQAGNLRALGADRQMMDTNLGLEGNMLGLGVNMAQAKGQGAWDQMIKQAGYDAATQEALQNWTRGNTVGDTNVANKNQWNQGLLQTLMSIIGSKAPGTTLPADVGGFYA